MVATKSSSFPENETRYEVWEEDSLFDFDANKRVLASRFRFYKDRQHQSNLKFVERTLTRKEIDPDAEA